MIRALATTLVFAQVPHVLAASTPAIAATTHASDASRLAPGREQDTKPRAIVFAPPAGTRLARTLAVEHDLAVTSMNAIQDGQARPTTGKLRVVTRQTLSFVDDLRRIEGGRPVLVQRVFGPANYRLELTTWDAPEPQTVRDVKTPLENASILFTWVPEEHDWGRYYDESDYVEEFLASLAQDLDLLALLPAEPVAAGTTWRVPADKLRDLFAPGGRLPMDWPKDLERQLVRSLASGVGGGLFEVFGGGAEGGAKMTFERVEVQGGDELAILGLDVDATLERDQFDLARERGSLEEPPPAGTIHRAHVRWHFRGRGELRWSTKNARMSSLRLAGEQEVLSRLTLDKDGRFQNELTMKGKLAITSDVAPPK